MLGDVDVFRILSYGVLGLGFLLALLAYKLLTQEQAKETARSEILRAIYVFMAFSLLLCGVGIVGQLIPKPQSSIQPDNPSGSSSTTSTDTTRFGDPCTSGVRNLAQCYLSFGHAWNDVAKYDDAIKFFIKSEQALKQVGDENGFWRTRAYLNREWGYALLGEQKCHDAAKKFEEAKRIFDNNNENDGGATRAGLAKARQCS